MDTRETYIEMSDCPEIQDYKSSDSVYGGHRWEEGDYYWLDKERHGYYSLATRPSDYYNAIWLPRQDQLQAMLDYKYPMSLVKEMARWLENLHAEEYLSKLDWSIEQLSLAFVKKELYGKTWDGEKWQSLR